ncbi:Solute carrier 2, facilitated glucose transporter member 6 [Saguinus oedipus]|uniref:Solute carrier 2, facilitated glucose transporter member 6 n=1 Tax=Saguinus oedipus TaxID=9490 RepID=A0ABQ9WJU0_SAGOE|nr:Solute carrier 2, facilitated glucose transporter member 6 [Saguinus oedipus]
MILLLSFMPNSPRFLLSRGRDEEALQALAWLRGVDADVHWEFEQIQDNVRRQVREGVHTSLACPPPALSSVRLWGLFLDDGTTVIPTNPSAWESPTQPLVVRAGWLSCWRGWPNAFSGSLVFQSSRVSWAEARAPHMCRPIAVALLMRFLQQLTGITPILVYLQSIFDSTAVLLPPKDDAAIVGAVRLLSVLIAALTMDLAGRKVLLFVSVPDESCATQVLSGSAEGAPREAAGSEGPGPTRATCLSTAAIMFAANLTLGLYIHFGPRPVSPNSTAGMESMSWGDLAQPLAAPTSYLTLVPLLATMLFIMGRCGGGAEGQATLGIKGWAMCLGWLERRVSSSSVGTDMLL